MEIRNANNMAVVQGEILSELKYSHEAFGEVFYETKLGSTRLSHTVDTVPVIVSERLVKTDTTYLGKRIRTAGQFRSYNRRGEGKTQLLLYLFAEEFEEPSEENEKKWNNNRIYLSGTICKDPVYRITPLGREVCDIMIAINRMSGKSDYIPCICWGRNAKYTSRALKTGDKISIEGRIQSRKYNKKMPDGTLADRTAYEVSIRKMELIESGQKAI